LARSSASTARFNGVAAATAAIIPANLGPGSCPCWRRFSFDSCVTCEVPHTRGREWNKKPCNGQRGREAWRRPTHECRCRIVGPKKHGARKPHDCQSSVYDTQDDKHLRHGEIRRRHDAFGSSTKEHLGIVPEPNEASLDVDGTAYLLQAGPDARSCARPACAE
jgi:hypothetical protein